MIIRNHGFTAVKLTFSRFRRLRNSLKSTPRAKQDARAVYHVIFDIFRTSVGSLFHVFWELFVLLFLIDFLIFFLLNFHRFWDPKGTPGEGPKWGENDPRPPPKKKRKKGPPVGERRGRSAAQLGPGGGVGGEPLGPCNIFSSLEGSVSLRSRLLRFIYI